MADRIPKGDAPAISLDKRKLDFCNSCQ